MQHHIQSLVKHLFHKDTLQEVTEEELRSFTTTHPYSAVGRLLFTKKLQETDAGDFREEARKTVLYFNNPAWPSWLLLHTEKTIKAPATENAEKEEHAIPAEQPEIHIPREPEITAEKQEEPVTQEPIAESTPAQEEAIIPTEPVTEEVTAAETESSESGVVSNPEEELVFQSYHTIDYFASQGIKLKPEDLSKDKLGKQLKSFTEWLRSMKRIAPAAINIDMDESTRQSIQLIAEHSVEGKEVETEAMAEVWAKQGNREKAIAIYSKLSLLNPAKSAYFAIRIEQLKLS